MLARPESIPWSALALANGLCSADGSREALFLYSFGPNRRRDSAKWESGGDDLRVLVASVP